MTLQEVMERVGSKKFGIVKAYVTDALRRIETLIPEKTTHTLYSVVAEQRLYSLPSDMVRLLGVYRKYSTSSDPTSYIKISRVTGIDLTDASSSTATDSETDIVVL